MNSSNITKEQALQIQFEAETELSHLHQEIEYSGHEEWIDESISHWNNQLDIAKKVLGSSFKTQVA